MILGMADSTNCLLGVARTPRFSIALHSCFRTGPTSGSRRRHGAQSNSCVTGTGKVDLRREVLYFRNRPSGDDTPAEPWGTWYYDNWRFWAIGAAGGNGPFIVLSVAESDMLAAEGYLRTGNIAAAATLIDKTRTRAGLPSVAGITNLTQQVPGGNACVPKVPQGPSFTTLACGTIFEP